MSMRGTKRVMGVRGDEPGVSKRRKTECEDALWPLRPVTDLKMPSIYNRSASEAPAELFRKDLISAMKLPDSEVLTSQEYWVITDTWKQEWERGVQVPVNPDSLPAPIVHEIENPLPPNFQEFKLPKTKYIHLNRDAFYQPDIHQLSTAPAKAETACKYYLDAVDVAWLKILNGERARAGAPSISEDQLERVIQELELRCWDKIQAIMKSEKGLGIEYDETVICDVCRSPDSEEGNEMVFCDACNICVHQACYGITTIPSGQWLCRPCGDGVKPTCVLCPNLEGAMKCTPSGHKWAHVSCVLWIPEVSIGCAEKMEPITKISAIPTSRWSLNCVLCRERKGACIQCSVKTCKTAYHVTCAFKHGLEMRAIIEDENADDGVKLRSYCQKHSVNSKKDKNEENSEEDEVKRKRRKDMTSEEKSQARVQRLHEIEGEFDKHVSIKDISTHLLDIDQDAIGYIYSYWKLKRRASHNRPLLPPKSDDSDLLSHRQEQADLDKMKMFVQLRQDLERVRNLCYMVSRREKLSRSFFRMREQTFHKQVAVLSEIKDLSSQVVSAVIEANHGPSIYDRMYSHPQASDNTNDFDALMARIAGVDSEDDRKKDINGLIKAGKISGNPYKKVYVNGSTRRSGSLFSGMSSEESTHEISRGHKYNKQAIGSSTDEDDKPTVSTKKKISPTSKGKVALKSERKKRVPSSRHIIESSSEEDLKPNSKVKFSGRSRTLKALEREMSARPSGSDSDDIMHSFLRSSRNTKFPADIYSDSSDASTPAKPADIGEDKSPNATNDSTQQLPRTKAAMKQFIPMQKTEPDKPPAKKGRKPASAKNKLFDSDDEAKNKENIKLSKSKDYPTDLFVPQRQAAKKASEKMLSTTKNKDAELSTDVKSPFTSEDSKTKSKNKLKAKEDKLSPGKERKKNLTSDLFDYDKDEKDQDLIAYVPQRQAAKKAAAHIKSGLGNKANTETTTEETKRKDSESSKRSPKKDDDKDSKCSSRSSTSSSSNSSSSSSSSSSSEDEDKSAQQKSSDAKQTLVQSPLPAVTPRPSVDLPFLIKVSKPLSSSSGSSDSDSTKEWERTPTLKRGRPQKNDSSNMSDEPFHKAPDKKLKTSERRTETRVSSPTPKGEERSRTVHTKSTPRSRTRRTTSSGNLLDKRESGLRKSVTDESSNSNAQVKVPKPRDKSSDSPVAQRKTDEAVNLKTTESGSKNVPIKETSQKESVSKLKSREHSDESPKRKSNKSQKLLDGPNLSQRRSSTFSPTKEDEKVNEKNSSPECKKTPQQSDTPPKKLSPKKYKAKFSDLGTIFPEKISVFHDHKLWASYPKSPPRPLSAIDSYRDSDISADKAYDDGSSFKMIAKIQATLNENTMIKSPKTPLDATTAGCESDVETTPEATIRKLSTCSTDTNRKFLTNPPQGSESSVHVADIPKKIGLNYPNRSMFSPQPIKDNTNMNDFLDFGNNILAVDDSVSDGFGNEESGKPFSFNSDFLFKEDPKEDSGVQETLNLVEKLRMTLNTKKTTDNEQEELPLKELGAITEHEGIDKVNEEKDIPNQPSPAESTQDKSQPSNISFAPSNDSVDDIPQDQLTIEETQQSTPDSQSAKWHFDSVNNSQVDVDGQGNTYHEKQYQSKEDVQYDKKEYEEVQYKGKTYQDSVYQEKSYHNTPYEKSYEEKQYNEKAYHEKEYDNLRSQFHHQIQERDNDINKHSVARPDEIRVSEQDHFADTISKQSDDSHSIMDQPRNTDHESIIRQPPRPQSYENNNSLPQSDCATISSPYRDDERTQSKWGESKITQRRSSASSTNSEGSNVSEKGEIKPHIQHSADMIQGLEYTSMRPYQHMHTGIHPGEGMAYSAFSSEASPFAAHNSVNLYPQVPGFYPPNIPLPYTSAPMVTNISKPFNNLIAPSTCNPFSSTTQNLVMNTPLTTAPTTKPVQESPPDDIDMSIDRSFSRQPSPSPSADSFNDTSSVKGCMSKISNDSNDTMSTQSTLESRSSTKAVRTMKFSGKSPGKSPGISPKTVDSIKSNSSKKSSSSKSSRGRGRGRSKTRGSQPVFGFPPGGIDFQGTIHSKLMGTVYELDFDEETANDGVDLKSMRERQRSIDLHDRKSDLPFKDSSQSPRLPTPDVIKRTPDTKEMRPLEPIIEAPRSKESPIAKISVDPEFPAIVQPVLPGPVDMRRYQPIETPTHEAYPFRSFDAVGGHQHLEFDEDAEKELQKSLAANRPTTPPKSPLPPEIIEPPTPFIPEPPTPKVFLSDSRDQLKVKIKGPFRDANYCASIQPIVPQPPQPTYEPPHTVLGTPSAVASATAAMLGGTSNLRRMRKKELLRHYWNQDMNMDDPSFHPPVESAPPPLQQSPLSRTIITIPKAVASMPTIPTREDYRAVVDANMEKKKRKMTADRELRHLQENMDDVVDDLDYMFPSFNNSASSQPPSKKARGRAPATKPNKPAPVTPKLKIKIGSNVVQPVVQPEESVVSGAQFKPPKKRISAKEVVPPTPSYEDLRRESMKFRKMMMAEFDESKKEKKKPKNEKTEKKKKKKGKKVEKMKVVNSKSESITKLVIKISRNREKKSNPTDAKSALPVDPFEYDPSAPDPLAIDPPSYSESCGIRNVRTSKVTPIRLKLARSSEGSGYVMKESQQEATSTSDNTSFSCSASSSTSHSQVR